jgi:starch synthase (maltosyl-transferring)
MRDRGFRVSVVSLKSAGSVGEMLRQIDIPVFDCRGRGGWDFLVIRRLAEHLKRQRPQIIHSLLFHANLAARLAIGRADFPPDRLLCEIQTVEVERRWHLWVDRWTHDQCRVTIGNSPSVIDYLAAHAHIPHDRLRLVRGGVDPEPIRAASPIRKSDIASVLGPDTPLVLWVGRLDPVKGLDFLVRAFREVASQMPAHLFLAGGGSLKDVIERTISELGLSDRAHLLGARQDVPRLLKSCDLFVFPSRTEGLPNALLEAMAAERPIVTTDVPGCRDLIRNGENGLLVPYGDVPSLAGAMLRLLHHGELSARLAHDALESVQRDWHISRTLNDYENLYRECAGHGRACRGNETM